MPRVAIVEVAGVEIENAGKGGDEQHFRVVARDFGVGRRHELAEIGSRRAQHRALAQRLADRHEDARRQALPGDIADQEEQAALVEPEEIVHVAADLARRNHRGGEIDARIVAQEVRARQRARLDPLRRVELAGNPRGLLALPLHDALERLLLPRRLGEGQHEQDAEEQQQMERRIRRIEQQPL